MPLPVPAIAIAAAVAVAGAGALVFAARKGDDARVAPPVAAPESPAPENSASENSVAETSAAEGSAPGDSAADNSAADPSAGETATAGAEAAARAAPSLDVVRVAPDGAAVVAGRAAPGATVRLKTEDGAVAETKADAAGEFVAVFEVPPSDVPRTLTAEAAAEGAAAVVSPDVVVLLPETAPANLPAPAPAPAPADVAAADPGPGAQEGDAAPAGVATQAGAPTDGVSGGIGSDVAASGGPGQEPPALAAASPETGPQTAPRPRIAAAAVVRGASVEATPLTPSRGLALASISYADSGAVTLSGVGAAGTQVLAYVDDAFAHGAPVGADGRWNIEIADLAPGVHRLRVDAVRPDGTVLARVETPFQRDIPPAPAEGADRPAAVTVQPGNNLWTLARIHYGSGVLYSRIYAANRDLVRDPELIYPGQILVLPESGPSE